VWQPEWRVRWIQCHYAGIEHIKLDVIPDHVKLTTASGIHSIVISENSFAFILALRRRIPLMLDYQHGAVWSKTKDMEFKQPLLFGQKIGILGYGSLGREIARKAKAFGMIVLAYKRNPIQKHDTGFAISGTGDPEGSIPAAYYGPENLHELLRSSDVVVNVLPATAETKGLLDSKAFAAMKQGALFINIGRAHAVDEKALIQALESGHLGGAGLDVYSEEPLPESSPLWKFPNVIISPHVGGTFTQYFEFCVQLFSENLARYLEGKSLLNEVDKVQGY
jgi:phosphoglycerate dehydrogenase-like enzyme